jgi:hypothetical protein
MSRFRDRRKDKLLYGWQHQKLRKALLPHAAGSLCTRCKQPIRPGEPVELDHLEGTVRQYRGWAHKACNRRAGWLSMRAQQKDPDPAPPRTQW